MTAVADAPRTTRSPFDVEVRTIVVWGLLTGLTMMFISATGMLEEFDDRPLIDPILSLGYFALLWVPVAFGFRAAREEVREGMLAPIKGARDLVSGAVTGAIGGLVLAVFAVLADSFEFRDIMPRVGEGMVDLLTFGQGVGGGSVVLVAVCAALGAAGGALHLLPERTGIGVRAAISAVFVVAVLQTIVSEFLDSVGLSFVEELLYTNEKAITIGAFVVVAALGAFLAIRFRGRRALIVQRYAAADPKDRTRLVLIAAGVIGVAYVLAPLLLGNLVSEILANVGLFLLMGLGLNVVIGYAGLLDLGYIAFFAVGAYAMAILTSPLSPRFAPELNFFVALPIVVGIAALAGLFVGTPVIRMRGDYLAIVTLGFGEIVRILLLSDWLAPTFGGAQGVLRIPSAELGPLTISGIDPQAIFYLVWVFVMIAAYVSWRLQGSRVGRAWMAMREDEQVAEAMGINTVTAKLLAFVTGAILASFGGALFAAKVGSVFPNSFEVLQSIIILVVVIVGGMGNIPGVFVGALVLIGVLGGPTTPGLLREFEGFKLLIYGTLLVYMMLQRPEGLVPSKRRSRELHQDEFLQDAWLQLQESEGGGSDVGPNEDGP